MNQIREIEQQNRKSDPPPYRMTPEEAMEEEWFAAGEHLSNPQDPREIAARRWEVELSL